MYKMFIFTLLFISISFVYSPMQDITYFPRIICFQSFSKPKVYLPLHIHTYTGPKFIRVVFDMYIKYSQSSKRNLFLHKSLYFKRVDGSCSYYNITFATNGVKYYELLIDVKFYLPMLFKQLSIISYIIEKGIESDKYMLIDEYGNFAISATITNSSDMSLRNVFDDENEAFVYLKTLRFQDSSHICFVTPFNRHDFIKPFFHNKNKEKGHIIGIIIEKINKYYEYPAFECDVPESDNNQTHFVYEGHEPNFFALTIKETEEISQEESFSIDKNNLESTDQMSNINNSNRVFLMNIDTIYCKDFTERKVYESKNKYYHASHRIKLEVDANIKRYQWVKSDPMNPCA